MHAGTLFVVVGIHERVEPGVKGSGILQQLILSPTIHPKHGTIVPRHHSLRQGEEVGVADLKLRAEYAFPFIPPDARARLARGGETAREVQRAAETGGRSKTLRAGKPKAQSAVAAHG